MYSAYITTIKELHKHSNADRLQCATIFGNNVIVSMDYYIGQRIIYFPVDGQLSEEFATDNNLVKKYVPLSELEDGNINANQIVQKNGIDVINVGGYMDPEKRNITAIRLRGEKSDGLALPIETLSKYVDVDTLKDGDMISVIDGHEICRKYLPKRQRSSEHSDRKNSINKKELKETVSYPLFIEHADTQQLAYNENAFKEGDICYITLKCHGTSARTSNTLQVTKKKRPHILKKLFHTKDKITKEYKYISGTRRVTLRDYNGGFYGSNQFRHKWHEFFKDKLPKGVEVYYEIVGYTEGDQAIMSRCSNKLVKDKEFSKQYGNETVFSYGCDVGENDIYVYRMTLTNEDGFVVEIPFEEMQILCEKMGVKCVPLFEKFIYTTWDDLMERVEKYYDGPDPIGKTHIREGVVVRIANREKFTAFKHKNFYFKCLSGIIKEQAEKSGELENMDNDLLEEM